MTHAVEPFGLGARRTSTHPGFSANTGRIEGEPCQVPPTDPEAGPPATEKSGMVPMAVAKIVVTAGAAGTASLEVIVGDVVAVGMVVEPEACETPFDDSGMALVVVEL